MHHDEEITTSPQRVVVIGQGYVGLPVAVAAAEAGFSVVGFDLDVDRVAGIAAGHSPTDDIPDDRLSMPVTSGDWASAGGAAVGPTGDGTMPVVTPTDATTTAPAMADRRNFRDFERLNTTLLGPPTHPVDALDRPAGRS